MTIEKKNFSPEKTFKNNQNATMSDNKGYLPTSSENIATSIIGTTPAKPEFNQSTLKQKQQNRLERPDYANGNQIGSPLDRDSPKFCLPKNESEFFSGRVNAQHLANKNMLDFNQVAGKSLITSLGESAEKDGSQYVLGYLLTDNTQK